MIHLCPVCLGTGNVPGGFYNCCPGGYPTSANCLESCRACGGRGVVDEAPQSSFTVYPQSSAGIYSIPESYKADLDKINRTLEQILKQLKGQNRHI